MLKKRPAVLCFSGHDPSGGAGIQADIETLISHQCHACSVITALTEQNSHNAYKVITQNPKDFSNQAKCILSDINISVIKIGLIASLEIASAIAQILGDYPQIKVVYDPVLVAGGGTIFVDEKLIQAIKQTIIPKATVLTPNSIEARTLTKQQNLTQSGLDLLRLGCQYVLITGGHEPGNGICNQLYQQQEEVKAYIWKRIKGEYHGSGCTLASSIAALLAHDIEPTVAINQAQQYVWNTLNMAYATGDGQYNPNRLFQLDNS